MLETIVPGDSSKKNPFTILIVGTPCFEISLGSGKFRPDPIMKDPAQFRRKVQSVRDVLFCLLPDQREQALSAPEFAGAVRVMTHYDQSLAVIDDNTLVTMRPNHDTVEPRPHAIDRFVKRLQVEVDVVFAVTNNDMRFRSSAFAMDDDIGPERGSRKYELDGDEFVHGHHTLIPGTVALHVTDPPLTALHEFQHAISSYNNGFITDLSTESDPAVNCKHGDHIPDQFCTYNGVIYLSDKIRDGLGYGDRRSYHPELIDPSEPALMDNFQYAKRQIGCQNDRLTRAFIRDRILAKISR